MADVRVVAIGASTGGPLTLLTILSRLPEDFPVPVLVTQHMAAGFIHGFAEWLGQRSDLPVHVAIHGEHILPGHIYIVPDAATYVLSPEGIATALIDIVDKEKRR